MNAWLARPLRSVPHAPASGFLADVVAGFCHDGQKTLPPKYLYDELGSMLFGAITRLPEYGVWRAERRLLEAHAETIATASAADLVVELGSGSAEKTRTVLEALLSQRRVTYCPVEISRSALDASRHALDDLDGLMFHGIARDYLSGVDEALAIRDASQPALVLFLGSSLGNFDAQAGENFLRALRERLMPGDFLLLGADLDKPEPTLRAAYDDALGVTAAFNLNVLARMNRELGADFRLPQFRHRIEFDRSARNVEMHIESLREQVVRFDGGEFEIEFARGETIHTETSHKYSHGE
ncbi:MAG: L-histidine N(alpha)-methyltransferase, partial [Rhodanobacteraceae bacterium]